VLSLPLLSCVVDYNLYSYTNRQRDIHLKDREIFVQATIGLREREIVTHWIGGWEGSEMVRMFRVGGGGSNTCAGNRTRLLGRHPCVLVNHYTEKMTFNFRLPKDFFLHCDFRTTCVVYAVCS
jgi:hypothetical protein